MDPSCNWCGDDMHNGAFRVEITKQGEPEKIIKEFKLCKKCAKSLVEK